MLRPVMELLRTEYPDMHVCLRSCRVEPVKVPRPVSSPLGRADTDDDPVSLLGEEQ